ncbi:alcohol dehydrogenase 1-like [Boleophthalmus pectinirostris]|uniref:alcohol dehydrogenase 1-like n=1 Tax=Boleophthalmus pectinirostris TaxID=150288 RepID=UPI0024326B77|nr:alcohol dehydrogenase 1-like [Boleophthalmus pectinirostris]
MATTGKVIQCKAAVAWEPNAPLVIEEIEVAPPQANEVRVQIVATSVCHSDLYHLYEGMPQDGFPVVLGHEAAGVVESVGSGVTEFKPGDKVIPLFISQCRDCDFCKTPKTNHCVQTWSEVRQDSLTAPDSRFSCKGKKILQFLGVSTFSEYTVVKQYNLAKIHESAPLDKVCVIGCGLCTGYGSAVNVAQVEEGSTCAVFGLGAVGLAAIMGCKAAGARRIIAVNRSSEKFEKAKILGATDCVSPRDHSKPIHQVLLEMTSGGVDFALECVGKAEVVESALLSTVPVWGVSVIVGYSKVQKFTAHSADLITGRTLKGALFGGFKSKDGVMEMVNRYMEKKIMLDELITHNMDLSQIMEAVELMKKSKCVRAVLKTSPQ